VTEPLFDLRPQPRPLTDRQHWIYGLIIAAGNEGLTGDELGALMHEQHGKHPAGERCAFCAQDGLRALREAAIAERCMKRGRYSWVALDAPTEPRPPSSQLDELPGDSWEDIFGSAA